MFRKLSSTDFKQKELWQFFIGTTVKMDFFRDDFSDSQCAEKIKSLFHEISKAILEEEEYEESESEEETAGEATASGVVAAVVEENEFL